MAFESEEHQKQLLRLQKDLFKLDKGTNKYIYELQMSYVGMYLHMHLY